MREDRRPKLQVGHSVSGFGVLPSNRERRIVDLDDRAPALDPVAGPHRDEVDPARGRARHRQLASTDQDAEVRDPRVLRCRGRRRMLPDVG
jgi:hypothetical protein